MFGLRKNRDMTADVEPAPREARKAMVAVVDAYDRLLDRTSPTLNCASLLPASKEQLKTYLKVARKLDETGQTHEALADAYLALATFQELTPDQAEAAKHCDFLEELQDASRKDPEFKSPKLKAKLLRYTEAMELVGPALDKANREAKRLAEEWHGVQS